MHADLRGRLREQQRRPEVARLRHLDGRRRREGRELLLHFEASAGGARILLNFHGTAAQADPFRWAPSADDRLTANRADELPIPRGAEEQREAFMSMADHALIQTLKCKPPIGKKNGDSLLALRNRIENRK